MLFNRFPEGKTSVSDDLCTGFLAHATTPDAMSKEENLIVADWRRNSGHMSERLNTSQENDVLRFSKSTGSHPKATTPPL